MPDDRTLTMRCGALRCRLEGFEDPFAALAALAPWLGSAEAEGCGDAALADPPAWASLERRDDALILRPAGLEASEEPPPEAPAPRPSPFTEDGAVWARDGAPDRRIAEARPATAEGEARSQDGREDADAFVFARVATTATAGASEAGASGGRAADRGAIGDGSTRPASSGAPAVRLSAGDPGPEPDEASGPPAAAPTGDARAEGPDAPDRPAEPDGAGAPRGPAERGADGPEALGPGAAVPSEDADADWSEETVVRLAEAARARLAGPEAERRRASLSRLRHAAQEGAAGAAPEPRAPRRRQPGAQGEAADAQVGPTERSEEEASALPPLVLTPERRVDGPGARARREADPATGPIRPRRVIRAAGAAQGSGAR